MSDSVLKEKETDESDYDYEPRSCPERGLVFGPSVEVALVTKVYMNLSVIRLMMLIS